jgi:hypothetical protein
VLDSNCAAVSGPGTDWLCWTVTVLLAVGLERIGFVGLNCDVGYECGMMWLCWTVTLLWAVCVERIGFDGP